MEYWVQNNIHLNLPFWIKEHQLNHGMVITSFGLVPGTKPALEFLSVPLIEWEESQTKLKIFTLLNSNDYIDYIHEINIKDIEIPFLTLDITLENNNIFVSQCNIFREKFVWENQISKPSQQLVKDIKDALNSTNPCKSLTKVFSEYGHVVHTEIIMGRLNDSTVTDNAAYDKINSNSWSLINKPKLIPLYEIFDEELKKQIQNLAGDEQMILMTGVTRLKSNKSRYYRVKFNNDLTSDDYQVIGSVIMNNKRFEGLNVKFQMMSISGFSIILEEYKCLKESDG
jgi:hypothetical protein